MFLTQHKNRQLSIFTLAGCPNFVLEDIDGEIHRTEIFFSGPVCKFPWGSDSPSYPLAYFLRTEWFPPRHLVEQRKSNEKRKSQNFPQKKRGKKQRFFSFKFTVVSLRGALALPDGEIADHVQGLVDVVQALNLEEVGSVPDGDDLVVAGLQRGRRRRRTQRVVYVAAFGSCTILQGREKKRRKRENGKMKSFRLMPERTKILFWGFFFFFFYYSLSRSHAHSRPPYFEMSFSNFSELPSADATLFLARAGKFSYDGEKEKNFPLLSSTESQPLFFQRKKIAPTAFCPQWNQMKRSGN